MTNYKPLLFAFLALLLLGISKFYSSEIIYRYYSIVNGRVLSEKLHISQDFATTTKKENITFLIRDVGHQKEQIALLDKVDWKFNYDRALLAGKVKLLSNSKTNCLIYQKIENSDSIPKYTYFIPSLGKVLLVYAGGNHDIIEFRQFCNALTVVST